MRDNIRPIASYRIRESIGNGIYYGRAYGRLADNPEPAFTPSHEPTRGMDPSWSWVVDALVLAAVCLIGYLIGSGGKL